jgi:hypothetical protein
MLRPADTYPDAVAAFRWEIPARYNIGVDVADKHVQMMEVAAHVEIKYASKANKANAEPSRLAGVPPTLSGESLAPTAADVARVVEEEHSTVLVPLRPVAKTARDWRSEEAPCLVS